MGSTTGQNRKDRTKMRLGKTDKSMFGKPPNMHFGKPQRCISGKGNRVIFCSETTKMHLGKPGKRILCLKAIGVYFRSKPARDWQNAYWEAREMHNAYDAYGRILLPGLFGVCL